MTIQYGVTFQGFNQKRLPEIKNDLESLFIQEFGDVNLDSQSVVGQIIGIFSKVYTDIWENEADVYVSQFLKSATGVSLDNLVAIVGVTRIQAQRTILIGIATGAQNTFIPINSLARIPTTNENFYSIENAFITSSKSSKNIVQAISLNAQEYNVLLNNTSYIYSIPIILFSNTLVATNIIQARINGINIPDVPFNTDSNTTLNDFLSQIILTLPSTLTGVVVGNSLILTPILGSHIIVNSILVSGSGAPTASTSFQAPSSLDDVAKYLSANIDNSTLISSTWISGNSFEIKTRNSQFSYSLTVGNSLQITSVSSPIIFLAQTIGVVPVPANSMNEILTPIAGWDSITNYDAGITGRNIETDSELRLRTVLSSKGTGLATVDAIRNHLLQDVNNVDSVTIFENVTLTQENLLVTFSQDFESLNNIQITMNGTFRANVVFTSNNLTTMNLIASIISSQPEINSCIVQGTGNHELLISIKPIFVLDLIFSITLGADRPTYTILGGRPPKSFEAIVSGGLDQEVALSIWKSKPAGIETFGNVNGGNGIIILDSQGNNQVIHFSRAIPVYIWVIANIILNPQEIFPSNGFQLISEAILSYGKSLGIGIDVLIQRVQSAVFSVQGVANVTIQLAKTTNSTDTPVYGVINIPISETEISDWDLSRIIVGI